MKTIVGMAAVFCLVSSASAFAQQAQKQGDADIAQSAAADQHQAAQEEVVEVANPFMARQDRADVAARPLTVRDDHTELKFGPYSRSEFAQAPAGNVTQPTRGAVGLAFSLKLGG